MASVTRQSSPRTNGFTSKADTQELREYQRMASLYPPLPHEEMLVLSHRFVEGRDAQVSLDQAELIAAVCGNCELTDDKIEQSKQSILEAFQTHLHFISNEIDPLEAVALFLNDDNDPEQLYLHRKDDIFPEVFWRDTVSVVSAYPQCENMTLSEFRAKHADIMRALSDKILKVKPAVAPKDVCDAWKRDIKTMGTHYLTFVKSLPFTPKQRRRASRKAEAGNRALETMVNHNLQLAMSRVSKVMKKNQRATKVGATDLIGAANLGLVLGARQFDPDMGRKFSTYAAYHIDGQLYELLNVEDGKSGIKWLSLHEQKQLNTLVTIKTTFQKIFNREATLKELQSLSGISASIIQKRLSTPSLKTQSINAPVGKSSDDSNIMLEDIIESNDNIDTAFNGTEKAKVLSDLAYEIALLPIRQQICIRDKVGIESVDGTIQMTETKGAKASAESQGITVSEFNKNLQAAMKRLRSRMELRGWDSSCLEVLVEDES